LAIVSDPAPRESGRSEVLAELRRRVDDARSGETRHSRLRAALVDLLAEGFWAPGDKLPPETELARASGLSLGTAQKALGMLAREGVLVRRHGHGTFVTGDASQADQLLHFRFVGDDDSAIAPVYAEAIDRRVVTTAGPWSALLPEAARFIRIRRRINVAQEFDCISELYVDADRFAAILELPMQELHRVVIRRLLAERFKTPTVSVDQRVYATPLPAEVAKLLKLDRAAFGLGLEVRSYTHHARAFAFQNIFIPPSVRRLQLFAPALTRPR
jgi:GntR family transcriptional regulator